MGKAIVFNGLTVNNPLCVVSIKRRVVSASDYVNEYCKLTGINDETQKGLLTEFVNSLISVGVWDNVIKCFPMLGGIDKYYVDLKSSFDSMLEWNYPDDTISWDSTRNAPFVSMPGNAKNGVPIKIYGLDRNNSSVFISGKYANNKNSVPISTPGYK